MGSNLQALVREINSLKSQVNNIQAPGLKYASVEQGGSITVREPMLDEYGNPALNADGQQMYREVISMGSQFDGSYAAMPVTSGQLPPPTPSTPEMIAVPGGIVIKWDGTFTDSLFAPMNFSRIETHLDTAMNFESNYADTIVGTTSSPRASYSVVQGLDPEVTYYSKLVCRDQAGARGPDSDENFVNPLPYASDAETLKAIQDAIAGVAQEAAAASQAASDAAQAAEVAQSTASAAQGVAEAADTRASQAERLSKLADEAAKNAAARAEAAEKFAQGFSNDIAAANNAAIEAVKKADTSMKTADGKNTITWSKTVPSGDRGILDDEVVVIESTEGKPGDIWFVRGEDRYNILQQYRYVADLTAESGWDTWSGPGWLLCRMTDSVIANLSAGKLTSGTLDVSTVIRVGQAFDEEKVAQPYMEIGRSSLQVFRPDPNADADEAVSTHVPTISIGGAEADSVIITDPATGDALSGLDQYGNLQASFASVDFLNVQGSPLGDMYNRSDILSLFPRGRVSGWLGSGPGNNSPMADTELGMVELGFTLEPYRIYKITFESNINCSAPNSTFRIFMRYTRGSNGADAPPPMANTSTTQLCMGFYPNGAGYNGNALPRRCHLEGWLHSGASFDDIRVLASLQRVAGGYPWMYVDGTSYFVAEDMGPWQPGTAAEVWAGGRLSNGGGKSVGMPDGSRDVSPTSGTSKTVTKTYPATWSRVWRGGSTDSTAEMRTGYSSGSKMTGAFAVSGAMQSDLKGSRISKVEMFVYAKHWYYSSGGTLWYGPHGSLNAPGSFPGQYENASTDWKTKTGGKWITLPSAWYPKFADGTYKGISFGGYVSSQSNTFYSRLYGAGTGSSYEPKLRVTYSK